MIWAQTVTSTRCTGQGGLDTQPSWPWGWVGPKNPALGNSGTKCVLRHQVSQKEGSAPRHRPTGSEPRRAGLLPEMGWGGACCWICTGLLIGLFLVLCHVHTRAGIQDFILEKMHELLHHRTRTQRRFLQEVSWALPTTAASPAQHSQARSSIQCVLGPVSKGPHAPETPRTISLFRVMINLTVAASGSFRGTSICMHFSLIFSSACSFWSYEVKRHVIFKAFGLFCRVDV